MARVTAWRDAGLVRDGLEWMQRLASDAVPHVLLATDLHAGNVLRAEREPWLAIDPKPFVGDPAFDATQHLLNCRERVARDARGTIGRFADGCGVDADRVRRWLFARVAAEPRTEWTEGARRLARRLGG
jgi:streptomycin 6-kinase